MPARAILAVVALCVPFSQSVWAEEAVAPSKDKPAAEAPAKSPAPPQPPIHDGPTVTPGGVPAEVIDATAVQGIIGRAVKSSIGEDMGHIVDFLVSPAGEVRAAVLDFGGVLGVGSRRVAVGWKALSFAELAKDGPVVLRLTRNQIRMAPELKSGDPIVILEPRAEPAQAKAPTHAASGEPEPAGAPPAPSHDAKMSGNTAVERVPGAPSPASRTPAEAPDAGRK